LIKVLAMVRSRTVRVAALIFQALWLNVVVPGHTRGIIRVPGDACPNCSLALSGSSRAGCVAGGSGKSPAGDPSAHCAICSFAAALAVPPAVDLTPPKLELLDVRPLALAHDCCFARLPIPYDGRAPPAFASPRI